MADFPDWFKTALQTRFDEQSFQSLQDPKVKSLREKMQAASKSLKQCLDETVRPCFFKWEEECNYLHGQELEWMYMQGVRDGAQLVLALMDSHKTQD